MLSSSLGVLMAMYFNSRSYGFIEIAPFIFFCFLKPQARRLKRLDKFIVAYGTGIFKSWREVVLIRQPFSYLVDFYIIEITL